MRDSQICEPRSSSSLRGSRQRSRNGWPPCVTVRPDRPGRPVSEASRGPLETSGRPASKDRKDRSGHRGLQASEAAMAKTAHKASRAKRARKASEAKSGHQANAGSAAKKGNPELVVIRGLMVPKGHRGP